MKCVLGILFFLLASPAWATWTLTQVKHNDSCTVAACAVTVTSTGSGHLLVAGLITAANRTISSVTAAACNTTWTHAPNTNGGTVAAGFVDLFYCTNSASGRTSITVTASGAFASGDSAAIWEASSTLGNIAIDSGATPSSTQSDTVSCTSCAGVALTLSGNNNFIAVLGGCGDSCTGLTGAGFTSDFITSNVNEIGHGITSGSLTAPTTYTQGSSSTLFADAAAFQESSAVETLNWNRSAEVIEIIDIAVMGLLLLGLRILWAARQNQIRAWLAGLPSVRIVLKRSDQKAQAQLQAFMNRKPLSVEERQTRYGGALHGKKQL